MDNGNVHFNKMVRSVKLDGGTEKFKVIVR